MSILSVKSLLLGKFSFGGGTAERITLRCAHIDFSMSVGVWLDSTQILCAVFTGSGVEKFTGKFINANACMKYNANPHNLKTTVCNCTCVDL